MGEVWWKSTLAKLNSTSIPSRFALSHSAKKQDCRGYSPARDAQSDEMSNKARARELRGGSSSGGGRVWPEGKGEALLPGSPPPPASPRRDPRCSSWCKRNVLDPPYQCSL